MFIQRASFVGKGPSLTVRYETWTLCIDSPEVCCDHPWKEFVSQLMEMKTRQGQPHLLGQARHTLNRKVCKLKLAKNLSRGKWRIRCSNESESLVTCRFLGLRGGGEFKHHQPQAILSYSREQWYMPQKGTDVNRRREKNLTGCMSILSWISYHGHHVTY